MVDVEVVIALSVLLFLQYLRRLLGEGALSPLNLISFMALVDVFIPFVAYSAFEWYPPHLRAVQKLAPAMIYYSASLIFIGVGYWLAAGFFAGSDRVQRPVASPKINVGFLMIAMAVLALIYGGHILKGMAEGDILDWFYRSCSRVGYGVMPVYQSPWDRLTTQLALPSLGAYVALLGLLVLVGKAKRLVVCCFAVLAVAMCLVAFSRGTIAILFFTFFYLLVDRQSGGVISMRKRALAGGILFFLSMASFFFYGAARNYCDYSLQAMSDDGVLRAKSRNQARAAVKNEVLRLTRGEGLVGLANILEFYEKNERLGGKTYKDSLLMPVPREIYPEKPMWYGAADITRPMDGRKSQDAVTIAGEAYANFGMAGVLLAVVWGAVLYFLTWLTRIQGYVVIYPALLVPAVISAMWMGSIGLVNHLVGYAIAWAIIYASKQRFPNR